MRAPLAALVFLLVSAAGAGGQHPPAERPAGQLLIDAVAFDRQGMAVTDLRREDVEVWLRGFRLPFESFTAVSSSDSQQRGRMVVLILDDVMLPPQLAPRAREAALRFVNRLSPGDRMAVVTLSGRTVESTDDRGRLLQIINSYNALTSTGPWRIDTIGEHVLKTVTALARQIAEAPYGRKVIVGIGTGWMFDTPIPAALVGGDLRPEWTDAMRAMALANTSLYVIEPGGVGIAPFAGTGSSGFARETGGHAFMNTNDLTGAADRIMREAANYYLIGVADPPIQRNAPLRDLEVKSLRDGVTVRARRAIHGSR
jgi:VWFA-related protein